jgi:hypothetical protein
MTGVYDADRYRLDLHAALRLAVPVALRLDADGRTDPRHRLTPQHPAPVTTDHPDATDPPVWVSPRVKGRWRLNG